MNAVAPGALRFLDPQVLARIGNLDLLARRVVDGFISGLHRTLHLGVSTDFAEHRAYAPGDDPRRLDWRVYARTDRLYVKTFEAETNADLVCLLDASGSMDYASDGVSKFDYGRFLAASLTHLGARQRDRVALATFDTRLRDWIPPAVKHRDTVLRTLDTLTAQGGSDFDAAAQRLAALLARRSIVVLVSDFYLEPAAFARALDLLGAAGHDLLAFQLLDRRELAFDLARDGVLRDLESGARIAIDPQHSRGDYLDLIREHTRALEESCNARGVAFQCMDTSRPLDEALFAFLARRARLAGRR